MISSYGFRLALLAPACFFTVHAIASLLMRFAARELIRQASRVSTRSAARLLFWARLAPAVLAFAIVAGLCVPSFLLHEQRTAAEGVGVACLIGAILGMASCGEGLVRGIRAVLTSSRALPDADRVHGLVALVGILRPSLLVSNDVRAALTQEQLHAALAHERAHWLSRDNLKQLLILLVPSILPGWRGLDAVDRAWKHFTEFAADDYAVAGDPQRSVDLAAALVRVSRLSASPKPVLAASLLDSCGHLELRVSRLLNPEAPAQEPQSRLPLVLPAAGLLTMALPLLHPAALLAIHDLLEKLIH
jgi:hypothetical protein